MIQEHMLTHINTLLMKAMLDDDDDDGDDDDDIDVDNDND